MIRNIQLKWMQAPDYSLPNKNKQTNKKNSYSVGCKNCLYCQDPLTWTTVRHQNCDAFLSYAWSLHQYMEKKKNETQHQKKKPQCSLQLFQGERNLINCKKGSNLWELKKIIIILGSLYVCVIILVHRKKKSFFGCWNLLKRHISMGSCCWA